MELKWKPVFSHIRRSSPANSWWGIIYLAWNRNALLQTATTNYRLRISWHRSSFFELIKCTPLSPDNMLLQSKAASLIADWPILRWALRSHKACRSVKSLMKTACASRSAEHSLHKNYGAHVMNECFDAFSKFRVFVFECILSFCTLHWLNKVRVSKCAENRNRSSYVLNFRGFASVEVKSSPTITLYCSAYGCRNNQHFLMEISQKWISCDSLKIWVILKQKC